MSKVNLQGRGILWRPPAQLDFRWGGWLWKWSDQLTTDEFQYSLQNLHTDYVCLAQHIPTEKKTFYCDLLKTLLVPTFNLNFFQQFPCSQQQRQPAFYRQSALPVAQPNADLRGASPLVSFNHVIKKTFARNLTSLTFENFLKLTIYLRAVGRKVLWSSACVCLSVCRSVCAHSFCPQDISRTGSWITTKFGGWDQGVNL